MNISRVPNIIFSVSLANVNTLYSVEEYINKDANGDLLEIVDQIKARLDPFSEEIREKLIEAAPKGSFREFSPREV